MRSGNGIYRRRLKREKEMKIFYGAKGRRLRKSKSSLKESSADDSSGKEHTP